MKKTDYSIKKLEKLENELKNKIDPEQYGFESIQDMLYTDKGIKVLGKILAKKK